MPSRRSSVRAALVALACVATLGPTGLVPAAAAASPSRPPPAPTAALPNAVRAPLASAVHIVKDENSDDPSCTGFSSQTTPPASIRVLITRAPMHIVTVPFEEYVENVLPNEWISSWDGAALEAGAVAVKSYAWHWVNHYGGYLNTRTPSNCFDVTDDTNFQVYRANSAQTRTNNAVQQSWDVIARDADTHEVRETFYICTLPFTATTSCSKQGPTERCGAGADGAKMSQYGSQACAEAGLNYLQILETYYFRNNGAAALELATVNLGRSSPLAAGPVALAASDVLVAYRVSDGDVQGVGQPAPGRAFGSWLVLNEGPRFAGQPSALVAFNDTLVVYARGADGRIRGDGQPRPGAAFTGWLPIGTGSPTLTSDPTPLIDADGAIVIYATASDGNVWTTAQPARGRAFGPWTRLSTGGGFSGKPAALLTAADQLVVYARHGSTVQGAGQSVAGGPFSGFGRIGTGTVGAGDPSVIQAGDGTLSIFVAGSRSATSGVWSSGQSAPGRAFGSWRQISANAGYASTPATFAIGSKGPIVAYAVAGPDVQGAQAQTPASAFSRFADMGTGTPNAAGNPSVAVAANGALVLYVIGADGNLWGTGQSSPGSAFSRWLRIGT